MEYLVIVFVVLGAWIIYYNKKHGAEEERKRQESIKEASNRRSVVEIELEKDRQLMEQVKQKRADQARNEALRLQAYERSDENRRMALEVTERENQQRAIEKQKEETALKNDFINSLRNGVIPEELKNFPVNRLSILLRKSERFIFGIRDTQVYTIKVKTRYVGGSSGVSFRIAKGVSIRTGGMRGHAEKYEDMENMGHCEVYVTDRNLYVKNSDGRVKKCPTSQIISIERYSNGIQVEFNRLLPLFIEVTGQEKDIMVAALEFNVRFLSE